MEDTKHLGRYMSSKQQWEVMLKFFESNHFSQVKLDSVNMYSSQAIPAIIMHSSPCVAWVASKNTWHVLEFSEVNLNKPIACEADGETHTLLPFEAQMRSLTYEAHCYIHILHSVYAVADDAVIENPKYGMECMAAVQKFGKLVASESFPYVRVFRPPVMTRSSLCHLDDNYGGECTHDDGGIFIINGMPKQCMFSMRIRNNYPIVLGSREDNEMWIEFRAEHYGLYRSTGTSYLTLTQPNRSTRPFFRIALYHLESSPIPFMVVMRALGMMNDDEIKEMFRFECNVMWRDEFMPVLEETLLLSWGTKETSSQENALIYIGKLFGETIRAKQIETATKNLHRELFPNIGKEAQHSRLKAQWFLYQCGILLKAWFDYDEIGDRVLTNRDSFIHKRIDTPYDLLSKKTRQAWSKFLSGIKSKMVKRTEKGQVIKIRELFDDRIVTKSISDLIATGKWTAKDKTMHGGQQTGLSQDLEQNNFVSMLAQTSKTIHTMHKESKDPKPRYVKNSSWGIMCPFATPEGPACGLIGFATPYRIVSTGTSGETIMRLIGRHFKKQLILAEQVTDQVRKDIQQGKRPFVWVFLNGTKRALLFGDGCDLVDFVRAKRRSLTIGPYTGVNVEYVSHKDFEQVQAVQIRTDGGRNCRPLFPVDKLYLLKTISLRQCKWNDLLEMGLVEYIDTEEEATRWIHPSVNHLLPAPEAAQYRSWHEIMQHGMTHFPPLELDVCVHPKHTLATSSLDGTTTTEERSARPMAKRKRDQDE